MAINPFRILLHCDWSANAKKRWVSLAKRIGSIWQISAPHLVGDTSIFVDRLFTADGPLIAGFDFPLGLPLADGQVTGLTDFPGVLEVFGQNDWAEFFDVADTPEQISAMRPFYPRRSTAGSKRKDLLDGLGIENFDSLRRACDFATPTRRQPASPLFWTLGGNQVGKAAIAGWREVIIPARHRGARLWPFDGRLTDLAAAGSPVLAETYPAEAYSHVGVAFRTNMSKRRQSDRRAAMRGLPDWARQNRVMFSTDLAKMIADGFGPRGDAEDAFDALIGLLGMIEVIDGRRLERPSGQIVGESLEGWILGQAA